MAPPAIGTVRQGTERNSRRNIPSTGIVKGAKGSASNPIILGDDLPPSTPRKPSAKIQNTRTAPFTSSKESSTKPLQQATKSPSRKRKAETESSPTAEKRARKFRPKAPQAFYPVYERALGQRFYVLKRTPTGTVECPEETFEMTGSTGNVYTVHIGRQPQCNCPHARKGNQCKHVLYVRLYSPLSLPPSPVSAWSNMCPYRSWPVFCTPPLISSTRPRCSAPSSAPSSHPNLTGMLPEALLLASASQLKGTAPSAIATSTPTAPNLSSGAVLRAGRTSTKSVSRCGPRPRRMAPSLVRCAVVRGRATRTSRLAYGWTWQSRARGTPTSVASSASAALEVRN